MRKKPTLFHGVGSKKLSIRSCSSSSISDVAYLHSPMSRKPSAKSLSLAGPLKGLDEFANLKRTNSPASSGLVNPEILVLSLSSAIKVSRLMGIASFVMFSGSQIKAVSLGPAGSWNNDTDTGHAWPIKHFAL